MRRDRVVGLGLAASLAVVACGRLKSQATDAGASIDAPPDATDATGDAPADRTVFAIPLAFCEAYYFALDGLMTRCLGWTVNAFGQQVLRDGACSAFVSAVSRGRFAFHPEKTGECFHALEASDCSIDLQTAFSYPACDAVTPLVQPDEACDPLPYLNECAGAAGCLANATCGARCVAFTPKGGPCGSICAPGTACAMADTTCQALGAEHELCAFRHTPCAHGLYCQWGDASLAGDCRPTHPSGPCSMDDECTPPAYCRGPAGGRACVPLKPPGASCTPGQLECSIASWCGVDHVCTKFGAFEGEPCGAQTSGETIACTEGTSCEMNGIGNSFCVSPRKAGEACFEDLECGGHVTGYCGFDVDAGASRCVSCPP